MIQRRRPRQVNGQPVYRRKLARDLHRIRASRDALRQQPPHACDKLRSISRRRRIQNNHQFLLLTFLATG
jgi:hypothetical protein